MIGKNEITGCSGSRADFRPFGIGLETLGEFRDGGDSHLPLALNVFLGTLRQFDGNQKW